MLLMGCKEKSKYLSVSRYFDFAEIQVMRHNSMYMADYVERFDNLKKIQVKKCYRVPKQ